jgi:hypothetical protein
MYGCTGVLSLQIKAVMQKSVNGGVGRSLDKEIRREAREGEPW